MSSQIVIIGAGFAGVWSALAAQRLINLQNKEAGIQVLVIAPEPVLVMRPRLYEAGASSLKHPLGNLFESAGIKFLQGLAEDIDTQGRKVKVRLASGDETKVQYDRLIFAAGSTLSRPQGVTGLREHSFDIDTIDSATKLESHLEKLVSLPSSAARDTIVICGAGFTGIELAAELPGRLGPMKHARIVLVENAEQLGPELGPNPRPVIERALKELGVEVKLGSRVTSVGAGGVTLASGERLETLTAIWTAGMRASPLVQQISGDKDALSRLHVDQHLRVPSNQNIFATGDTAYARTDDQGNYALQSCQHALALGRVSGHNAVADILGQPMVAYSQISYNCCLDLGGWGSVVSRGWQREVGLTGALGKRVKSYINQGLIYPPESAEEALGAADPLYPDADKLFDQMVELVC